MENPFNEIKYKKISIQIGILEMFKEQAYVEADPKKQIALLKNYGDTGYHIINELSDWTIDTMQNMFKIHRETVAELEHYKQQVEQYEKHMLQLTTLIVQQGNRHNLI